MHCAFAARERMEWGSCCSCCADRWTQVNQDIADQLQKAQSLLQLWKAYNSAHTEAAARLEQQEAKYRQLANINMSGNNLAEILTPALRDLKVSAEPTGKTKATIAQQTGPWLRDWADHRDREGIRAGTWARCVGPGQGREVCGWERQVAAQGEV